MDFELEIEQGGQSEQLADGLKTSTQNFGEDMLISAGAGAGDVVASTGINIGTGSTDQIIADNIAAAVNLTGEQGLTNLANNLQGYTQQLAAMGLNAPEELVNIILDEIEVVLGQSGVIDAIKTGMQITQGTVELAKMGLQYATSIATIIGNIQKLLLKLNKMQDADVMCVPSVKDSLSALTASLINQLKAQYEALKQQLIIFYNSMICTSNDAVLDNIVVSVNNILEVIEPALDPVLQKYTGHTLSEIRNICNQGFAYIGMIQRAAANKRKQKEEKNKQPQEEQAEETQEEKKKKQKLTKEEKEKLKKERIEKSKKKWEEKTKDLSIEQSKEKLMIWLKDQSIMIQNAFQILIIKDTIESIKQFISQLQNTSIENQMDLLNTINNILEIFEMLGLTPDAKGITMEDLKKLGMAAAGTLVETAIDMGNQVQNNAQAFTDNMINEQNEAIRNAGGTVLSENVIQDAKGTVAGISDKAMGFADNAMNNSINGDIDTGEVAANTAGAVGSEIVAGMVDQGAVNIIGAGLNMDMNAIANGDIPVIETQAFTYTQSNENKNIYINITINKNPSLHLLAISSFIKSFRSGTKEIFNNGATKQIKDAFKDAWDINDTIEIKIQAIVDGVTKFYIFTFNINQDARKKSESNQASSETNIEDDLLSKAKNSGTDIKNGAMSTLNGAKGQASGMLDNAENMASGATDNVMNAAKNAESQLTKVNINIDAALLESVLYDPETGKRKILMFDEVVQFLKILQPIVQILQVIAHILENYMINKEFVRTGQRVNLANALKQAAQLINGLKDLINLKDTNFFTIRTKEMADWALSEFGQQPDESGFITIGILDTTTLNTYCAVHAINPDYPLNLLKGTTLYFDDWGIEHGGYNDGTSIGLDNIEINRDLGEVYYDKQRRSTISSEILRARKKNVNPYYEEPKIEMTEEKYDTKSFLDAITFTSDEFEGQQTLSICDLNLCQPSSIDKSKSKSKPVEDSAVIVEFGDEYTLGNKVNYDLVVKPGQTLVEGDILGYIKDDGKQIPIRTQYTGIIRSIDESNSDYKHLYPSMAGRHIIIDNPVKCSASDYNINDVMSLQQKFKKATELEALIINCMPLSVLPGLLVNANRKSQPNVAGSPFMVAPAEANTVYTSYDKIIKKYDESINAFAEKLKTQSENLKSNLSGQDENTTVGGKEVVNISPGKAEKLKDDMLNDRKLMVELAINSYENAVNQSVYGDVQYLDCIGLAYDPNITFKRTVGDDTLEYNNYYINLLRSIPDTQKQTATINISMSDIQADIDKLHLPDASISAGYHVNMDSSLFSATDMVKNINNINLDEDGPDYINEFRTIVQNIIDIRLAYEKQNITTMINVFTKYYNEHILNGLFAQKVNNAYDYLNKYINENNIDRNNTQEILNKIKKDKLRLDNKATTEDINKAENDKRDNDYFEVCKQALTLFMYISNSDIRNDETKVSNLYKDTENATYIRDYSGSDIDQTVKNIEALYISNEKQITYNSTQYTNFNDLYDAVYKKITESLMSSNPMGVTNEQIKNATIKSIMTLLDSDEKIVTYLINVKEKGTSNLDSETKQFFEDAAKNNMFYQMIKDEAKKIDEFWKKIITEYKSTYNVDKAIKDIQDYANGLNSNAKWPQSLNIKVDNTNYELYTFTNPFKTPKKSIAEIPYVEEDMDNLEDNIKDPIIDLEDVKDIRENDPITIFDYEYWLVYMLNATLFTLIPIYWADGFDIPPFMVPLPLPAIYLPIAPPVMIPIVNVLMVFGIALRGMWPAPIILMINLSSDDIDVMIFLKIALEIAKDIFKKIQETVENTIPMMVNQLLMGYINENEIAQKAIEKFRTYSSIIKAIPIENKALIEKQFNEALQEQLNKPSKLNNANAKLSQTQENIKDKSQATQEKVDEGITNLAKKRDNYIKKYDRRQVLTRESDLGDGPAPM